MPKAWWDIAHSGSRSHAVDMKIPLPLPAIAALGLLAAPVHAADAEQPRIAISDVDQSRDRSIVAGNAAVLGGRLAVVGNCVVVEQENGSRVLPVFPSGIATWDAAQGRLKYFRDTWKLGDRVAIGGGSANRFMSDTLLASDDVDIPSDCPTSEIWVAIGYSAGLL
jgi:hypothetical protein